MTLRKKMLHFDDFALKSARACCVCAFFFISLRSLALELHVTRDFIALPRTQI